MLLSTAYVCVFCECVRLSVQGHIQHGSQFPAAASAWQLNKADGQICLPTEGAAASASLLQPAAGRPHLPLALLPLPPRAQERVSRRPAHVFLFRLANYCIPGKRDASVCEHSNTE